MIDLRSDTVTQPTAGMRQAMTRAPVGDDVYREDPSVNELEQETARILGKEAAVFVTSGTQGNQCALLATTHSGEEIWAHEAVHLITEEQAGAAMLARVQVRTFAGDGGRMDVAGLGQWLRDPADDHNAPITLICLENAVGVTGAPLPQEYVEEVCAFAHGTGMRVHMDGARLWDASVATGATPAEIARNCDTVSVCFSKSLGAPVGSAVAGSAELIARARRARKLLGGGMRQAGIIAAGATYALRNNLERLAANHERALQLADGIAGLPRLRVDPSAVATSMVMASTPPGEAARMAAALTEAGVGCFSLGSDTVRFVVHLDIGDEDIDAAIKIIRRTAG
jgi:threonine aldolase